MVRHALPLTVKTIPQSLKSLFHFSLNLNYRIKLNSDVLIWLTQKYDIHCVASTSNSLKYLYSFL